MSAQQQPASDSALLEDAARARRYRIRRFKDILSRYVVGIGGIGVIISLALIFIYLFTEVGPMLMSAHAEKVADHPVPGEGRTVALSTDRFRSLGFRLGDDGSIAWFRPRTGETVGERLLELPPDARVTAHGSGEARTGVHALGLSDGRAMVVESVFVDTFPEDRLVVVPELAFPMGEEPMLVDPQGRPLVAIGVQRGARGLALAAVTEDQRLILVTFRGRTNFLTGETVLTPSRHELPAPAAGTTHVLLSISLQEMILADGDGVLHYYDISRPEQARLVDSQPAFERPEVRLTAAAHLLGTVSVIVGGSDGSVQQWFLVRDAEGVRRLTLIREFERHPAAVTAIAAENTRKGFATGDSQGNVAVHYSTSHRTLLEEKVSEQPIASLAISPRNDGLFVIDDAGRLRYFHLDNEHPAFSLSALWSRVWYEGRETPEFVWQSSSATDEFEPKYSLVPLTVGTLKAAFYAMLFAMPLAIMGAIYSAYFMSRRMRGYTKPAIEIMEALPTVILGFLAGLWFAPYVERHLPAVFSILILMPAGILFAAFCWSRLSDGIRGRVSAGWEAALLIPVVLFIGWACITASPWVELWWFGGDMRQWLTDMGINYDQRNAMIVGVAMGFAVIPTIYSIAEDAVFNVPRHLTQGSLALGATPWQTMTRVVLLTASPGIFAAVMIGLGRAVGETMIVLMATGNSPVVNFNIFEGLRTLSANIAVEMPEAEFGGTHYRILFLSALVLFLFTFVVNTIAELVRQRLRKKYASI